MVVVGHQAKCDYCSLIFPVVAVDEVQAVFVVSGVEEYQPSSDPTVVDVVIVVAGEYVASIGHRFPPFWSYLA
jgi:hypothetical protein